jgi:hypothetical protein
MYTIIVHDTNLLAYRLVHLFTMTRRKMQGFVQIPSSNPASNVRVGVAKLTEEKQSCLVGSDHFKRKLITGVWGPELRRQVKYFTFQTTLIRLLFTTVA